jgi:putative ABC transport system substrate-binding protein
VSDPIAQGVVDNLARPTGNLTGFSYLEQSLMGKWLQILKEAAPGLRRAGLMIHIGNAASPIWYRMFKDVAPTLAIEPISAPIRDQNEIEGVIKSMAAQPNGALLVTGDNLVSDPPVRRLIIDLAATYRLPALYGELQFALGGGLISYGVDRIDQFKRAASYVDRILKGERPSDLPVQQPTKFDFVINLKTAKALGIELPLTLQMTADEVIQ